MLALAVADEAAYAAFRSAAALPRSSLSEKAERTEAMQAALVGAALVPLATARASRDLLPDIAYVAVEGNRHLRSDALIAAILADAAVRSCAINVRVNTAMLRDKARASELDAEVEAIVADSSDLLSRVV